MKVGDLVRLGDSWAEEDRAIGIIKKVYQYNGRDCCDVLLANGDDVELIYMSELEVIKMKVGDLIYCPKHPRDWGFIVGENNLKYKVCWYDGDISWVLKVSVKKLKKYLTTENNVIQ